MTDTRLISARSTPPATIQADAMVVLYGTRAKVIHRPKIFKLVHVREVFE